MMIGWAEAVRWAHGNPLREALVIALLQQELERTTDLEMAEAIRDLLRAYDRSVMS